MSALIGREDRLVRTAADVLGVTPDALSEDASPDTVSSWDSLGHLNLVIALEEEFGVSLSADDVLAMRDVGSIRRVLRHSGVEV